MVFVVVSGVRFLFSVAARTTANLSLMDAWPVGLMFDGRLLGFLQTIRFNINTLSKFNISHLSCELILYNYCVSWTLLLW